MYSNCNIKKIFKAYPKPVWAWVVRVRMQKNYNIKELLKALRKVLGVRIQNNCNTKEAFEALKEKHSSSINYSGACVQ